jgi:hypothetical protein
MHQRKYKLCRGGLSSQTLGLGMGSKSSWGLKQGHKGLH